MYEVLTTIKEKKLFIILMMSALLAIATPGVVFAEGEGGDTDLGEGQTNAYQTFLDEHVKVQSPEAQDDYVSVLVDRPSDEDVQNGITEEMVYSNLNVIVKINGVSQDTVCQLNDPGDSVGFVFTTSEKFTTNSNTNRLGTDDVVEFTSTFIDPDSREELATMTSSADVGEACTNPQYKKKALTLTVTPNTKKYTYNGKENRTKVTVTGKCGDVTFSNAALKDTYSLSYANIKSAAGGPGKAKVTVTMEGDFEGTATANYSILPREIVIKTIKPKTASFVYNGSQRKSGVILTATYKDNGKAVPASVLSNTTSNVRLDYEKTKNVGTAKVTATMKNNYKSNSKSTTYVINPKNATFKSVKPVKKGFTANWTPQKTKMATFWITGYQVRYSLKKNFSGAKIVTVGTKENSSYKLKTKKIIKLKAKKTYYVQIRTYKKLYGKKYFSPWSKTLKVKTK